MLRDHCADYAHESYGHGNAVPDEGLVIGVQMIIARAKCHQNETNEHGGPGVF